VRGQGLIGACAPVGIHRGRHNRLRRIIGREVCNTHRRVAACADGGDRLVNSFLVQVDCEDPSSGDRQRDRCPDPRRAPTTWPVSSVMVEPGERVTLRLHRGKATSGSPADTSLAQDPPSGLPSCRPSWRLTFSYLSYNYQGGGLSSRAHHQLTSLAAGPIPARPHLCRQPSARQADPPPRSSVAHAELTGHKTSEQQRGCAR